MNLSTHLKIGQRIYFTGANARNVVLNPLEITLAVFVISCPCNLFARTVLYVEDLVYTIDGIDASKEHALWAG